MITQPIDKLVLELPTKYTKNFTDIMKRAAVQNFASLHLEDLVQITGTVVSIPKKITNDRTHQGFSTKDIQVGDGVIFSFNIVFDWISKDNADPIYKNLITYKGKEFWVADITKIFAVIRNGKIKMINGYVMATPFVDDIIVVSAVSKKAKGSKSSTVMHIGSPKENLPKIKVKDGDTIYFNPMIVQKYQINDKPFIILQQHQVLGKVSE